MQSQSSEICLIVETISVEQDITVLCPLVQDLKSS